MAAIDEVTIPGGVCVFFTETGGTERLLGNIVGDSVSIERDTDEIDHFTNKPGLRRKDKVFTVEENVQIDFELDEINVNNLRYFFKGGVISTVGAGTAPIVDQKETSLVEEFVSVERPGLTAVTARQFLDNVFFDDAGTFIDHSVEADTAGGTAFEINDAAADFLYMGKAMPFAEVGVDVDTASSGYTGPVWEYWDGTTWSALVGLSDGTSSFTVDGIVTHTPQSDWATVAVNSVTQYWIRFSQTADPPTTPATLFHVGRQVMVEHTDFGVDPGAAGAVNTASDGAVRRIAVGILEPAEEFKVSFTYVTFASQTFGIAEQSILEGSGRFINAPQSGRGTTWEAIFSRVQLTNNGAMDLDDSDFQTIPLSFVVLDNTANDPTNPFGTIRVTS